MDGPDEGYWGPPADEEPREYLPPQNFHNAEAEAALIAALMIDNRLVGEISERLKREDFSEPLHGRLYGSIVRLVGNGKLANPVTLKPLFELDPDIAAVGGFAYLANLTSSGQAAVIGARDFADQIIELARMRDLHQEMLRALKRMTEEDIHPSEAIDGLEQAIWSAADRHRPIRLLSAGQMMDLAMKRIDDIQTQDMAVGAKCRTIPELDSLLGPLEGGQYTILAGRPSMGKTTTALSAAWGYAANGDPTLYCHAEMSSELISLKVASDISYSRGKGILFKNIRKGLCDETEMRWLREARDLAEQLPLRYADVGRADIKRIDAIVARNCAYWEAKGRQLKVVFVDYLGLLTIAGAKVGDDRARVSQISKGLLDIAQKYGVHVVALAQLSRGLEQRVEKRPMLSDLRDSGDLEQDADMVVFVYRHEWYLEKDKPKPPATEGKKGAYEAQLLEWEIDMAECRGKVEIIAEKNRLGERGWRKVRWHGDYSAVRGLTTQHAGAGEDDLFQNWGGPDE